MLFTGPVEAEVSVEVDTLAGGAGVDGAVLSPHSVLQGLVKTSQNVKVFSIKHCNEIF